MHVKKNVYDSLLNIILGMDKSKDTDNAKKDLADIKIRPELYLFTQGDKLMKLASNFTLTPEEYRQLCNFIKSIKFPNGFSSNLTKNITNNDNKIVGLKLHDCHLIMQQLLLLGI